MKKISNIKRMREILSIIKKHDIKNGLTPIKAREMIEELGPTYVKLGQIMSMRSDLIPLEYCKEFEKLRASIAPLSFSTIRSIIEEELGQPIENVFKDIEEKPIREFDSCLQFFTNQIAQNVDYINAFEFFYCQICENNCTNMG